MEVDRSFEASYLKKGIKPDVAAEESKRDEEEQAK